MRYAKKRFDGNVDHLVIWCNIQFGEDNFTYFKGLAAYRYCFLFRDEKDATLFSLRWGS